MSNRAVSVLEFVSAVQKAVTADFEREGDDENALVVTKVDVELKTALERTTEGTVAWKVISVEGNYLNSQMQTLALSWERKKTMKGLVADDQDLGYELLTGLDALRIGESEWRRVSSALPFVSTGGTLTFEVAVSAEGKLTVLKLGASTKNELTHTVKLTLAPLG